MKDTAFYLGTKNLEYLNRLSQLIFAEIRFEITPQEVLKKIFDFIVEKPITREGWQYLIESCQIDAKKKENEISCIEYLRSQSHCTRNAFAIFEHLDATYANKGRRIISIYQIAAELDMKYEIVSSGLESLSRYGVIKVYRDLMKKGSRDIEVMSSVTVRKKAAD